MPRKRKAIKGKAIKECPFRAGDIVQLITDGLDLPNLMLVTSVMDIPNLKTGRYGPAAAACPYWFFATHLDGSSIASRTDGQHKGAIWAGNAKLHPFLGPAKREVMDHADL